MKWKTNLQEKTLENTSQIYNKENKKWFEKLGWNVTADVFDWARKKGTVSLSYW